uniref:Uncharacterized protein n=1 Tax=Romanomermis culicivorax TaxID=13658 RepID=A0A915JBJ0_ROMCU
MALTTGSLFFFLRSVRNWVPSRAYIPTQLWAPSKETTMEKGDTPRGDGGLGGDVTLTSAFCQLDPATISGWKIRLLWAEARNRNEIIKE